VQAKRYSSYEFLLASGEGESVGSIPGHSGQSSILTVSTEANQKRCIRLTTLYIIEPTRHRTHSGTDRRRSNSDVCYSGSFAIAELQKTG